MVPFSPPKDWYETYWLTPEPVQLARTARASAVRRFVVGLVKYFTSQADRPSRVGYFAG